MRRQKNTFPPSYNKKAISWECLSLLEVTKLRPIFKFSKRSRLRQHLTALIIPRLQKLVFTPTCPPEPGQKATDLGKVHPRPPPQGYGLFPKPTRSPLIKYDRLLLHHLTRCRRINARPFTRIPHFPCSPC